MCVRFQERAQVRMCNPWIRHAVFDILCKCAAVLLVLLLAAAVLLLLLLLLCCCAAGSVAAVALPCVLTNRASKLTEHTLLAVLRACALWITHRTHRITCKLRCSRMQRLHADENYTAIDQARVPCYC